MKKEVKKVSENLYWFFVINTVICEWVIIAYDLYHW